MRGFFSGTLRFKNKRKAVTHNTSTVSKKSPSARHPAQDVFTHHNQPASSSDRRYVTGSVGRKVRNSCCGENAGEGEEKGEASTSWMLQSGKACAEYDIVPQFTNACVASHIRVEP